MLNKSIEVLMIYNKGLIPKVWRKLREKQPYVVAQSVGVIISLGFKGYNDRTDTGK